MNTEETRRGLDNPSENINPNIRKNYTDALTKSKFRNFKQWANACDVNYISFHNYSSGKSYPSIVKAHTIAKAAGIEVTELYPKEILNELT